MRPLSTTLLVHAVEADLQNLLINLLLNAVQASKAGSEVTIRVQQSDKIRVSIPRIKVVESPRSSSRRYSSPSSACGMGELVWAFSCP